MRALSSVVTVAERPPHPLMIQALPSVASPYFSIGEHMALIKCPECGNEVSDKAVSCPRCGCPIAAQETHGSSPIAESTSTESNQEVAGKAVGGLIHGKKFWIVAAAIVVVAVACYFVYRSVVPQYSGLPEQVASQVGYVSDGEEFGPRVRVAISIYPGADEGDDTVMMWDPDEEYIVGFAHLSEPLTQREYGREEIVGTVTSCDGEDEFDLKDASLVD